MLFRRILPTSTALLCPFVLSSLVFAQAARTVPPRDHQGRPALLPVVFHGIVLDPDGAPAAGALVMSSAGGKTVADLQGRYRFEADVPPEAERVQVTAILGDAGSLIAHTSVELGAPSRFVRVEPLLLAPGATCPPVWLPTFGGQPGVDGTINALTVFDDGTGPALLRRWRIHHSGRRRGEPDREVGWLELVGIEQWAPRRWWNHRGQRAHGLRPRHWTGVVCGRHLHHRRGFAGEPDREVGRYELVCTGQRGEQHRERVDRFR